MNMIRETQFDGHESGADLWAIPCNETSDAERLCKNPLVSVFMITYNHEGFIRQAIEGVVMQETEFEYELVLGEDCSTDRTREICFEYQRQYPEKVRVLWSESNLWAIDGNAKRVQVRCRGKYIAFCEGDDYWTDPKKLQKQVEYMEAHSGCAGCFHEWVIDEGGQILEGTGPPEKMKRALTGDDIASFRYPVPQTATLMFRREVFVERPKWLDTWKAGDVATLLWASYHHGTVDWLEGMAPSVYRFHAGGVFRGLPLLSQILFVHETCRQAIQHFPVSTQVKMILHEKWAREDFFAWRRWHASKSDEEKHNLSCLIRGDMAMWPMLRWRLWARQMGYWLERGRALTWHGLVLGVKSILPSSLYQWAHRQLKGKGQ